MDILVTGGSGYVGSHLCRALIEDGHQIVCVGRRRSFAAIDHRRFHYISADTTQRGAWQDTVAGADAIINLTGASIFRRWTRRYKRTIYRSRIDTTHQIVSALPADSRALLINTSAVGYYGSRGDEVITESTPPADDFLARVAVDWEAAAKNAEKKGCRVVMPRFGVVLSEDGGAMAKMLPAFRKALGGPIGSGRQWFPWIHTDDLVNIFRYVLDHPDVSGPLNATAPEPVRQGDFAQELGRALHRPAVLPVPAAMIRLALGEFADTLTASQRVVPARLLDGGFVFLYRTIAPALAHIVAAAGQ